MNADRRKTLAGVVEALNRAKADIEIVLEQEQEALENMPEGLQDGPKGETLQESADKLEEQIDAIDCIQDELGEL